MTRLEAGREPLSFGVEELEVAEKIGALRERVEIREEINFLLIKMMGEKDGDTSELNLLLQVSKGIRDILDRRMKS